MNIELDTIKSHSKDLIKIVEETQKKAEQHLLTKQELLEFLRKVKGKSSLVIEGIDKFIDTGDFDPEPF